MVAVLVALAGKFVHDNWSYPSFPVVGWTVFAIVQGTVWTGLWVVGHECGHHAFSKSNTLNDAVGFVVHSALLVPYFSWQYTHKKHHKYTNHTVWGESHVPATRRGVPSYYAALRDALGEDAFSILNAG